MPVSAEYGGVPWVNSHLTGGQLPAERTPEEHKVAGNGYLAKGWLVAAELAYSAGLRAADGTPHVALRLNRAAVRLKLGLFRSALADATAVLSLHHSTYPEAQLEKALYRASSAAYGLQLWDAVEAHYQELAEIGSKEGAAGLKRVAERRKEAETGVYDWPALYAASQTDPNLDAADSFSDAVHVEAIPGKGRGLVVDRPVRAGELLIMSRPLASAHPREMTTGHDVTVLNIIKSSTESSLTLREAQIVG